LSVIQASNAESAHVGPYQCSDIFIAWAKRISEFIAIKPVYDNPSTKKEGLDNGGRPHQLSANLCELTQS